jgi:hypothetical protein
MNTDELIQILARDAAVGKRNDEFVSIALVGTSAVVVGLLFVAFLGPRANLAEHIGPVVMKLLVTGLTGIGGLALVFRLARPTSARFGPAAILGAAALVLAAWSALCVIRGSENLMAGLVGASALRCLVAIPILSLAPLAALVLVARRGAVTRRTLAGFSAGLAAAGVAASFYALNCPEDSPLFVMVWYGMSGVLTGFLGAVAFGRLVRW